MESDLLVHGSNYPADCLFLKVTISAEICISWREIANPALYRRCKLKRHQEVIYKASDGCPNLVEGCNSKGLMSIPFDQLDTSMNPFVLPSLMRIYG